MANIKRNKAIYNCHKDGLSQSKIGNLFELSQSAVSEIIRQIKNGENIVKEETRGAKPKLTNAQKDTLKSLLKEPASIHNYTVWDKWSIKGLIKTKFGVDYHENYIYKIMKSIRFSSQKPKQKDYRQSAEKVTKFKEEKVIEIKKKVIEENRRLVFQDESAVRLIPSITNTYAPIGQTPVLECDTKNREYVSISGAISPCGYFYFEVREMEGFKQKGLTRFLDNLYANCLDKMLIIWDNASSHHSKTVKAYLAKQNQDSPTIWLENIPPYSPVPIAIGINPIEQLWGNLKKRLSNQFFKTTKELREIVTKTLNEIKKDKKLIKSFFKNKELNCYQLNI